MVNDGGSGASTMVYNSQLVSLYSNLYAFHAAEPGLSQDAFTLYNQMQEDSEGRAALTGAGPALPALGHAFAGSIATAASKLLIYPLDLIIARLQVQRQLHGPKEAPSAAKDAEAEYAGLVDAAKKIYKREGGISAFYTGCAPDVARSITDSFLFFLAYEFVRKYELSKQIGGKALPVYREIGVGVAAGAFSKLVTTPLQNIITRQQTAAMVAARNPNSTKSPGEVDKLGVRAIARQIHAERGLQGFWAGYSASIILTLNPALTFAIDNALHQLLPTSRKEKPGAQLTFLIAAVSKAIATAITYPVSLAKSRAQVQSPTPISQTEGTEKVDQTALEPAPVAASNSTNRKAAIKRTLHKYLRLLSAQYAIFLSLRRIYSEEGLKGLYSGLEAEVLKGFLSHGLTMMVKDRVHVGVIQVYYMLLRYTSMWPEEVKKAEGRATEVAKDASVSVKAGAEQIVEQGRKVVGGEEGK